MPSAKSMFCAVFGYDTMGTSAEESTGGMKHMPKAIIFSSLVMDMLLDVAIQVLTCMQNYRNIGWTTGIDSAFNRMRLPVTPTIIPVFAVLSIHTVMLTLLRSACQPIVSWQVSAERQQSFGWNPGREWLTEHSAYDLQIY